jgi:hypothetical protein
MQLTPPKGTDAMDAPRNPIVLKLDLSQITFTQEEILADLLYPEG